MSVAEVNPDVWSMPQHSKGTPRQAKGSRPSDAARLLAQCGAGARRSLKEGSSVCVRALAGPLKRPGFWRLATHAAPHVDRWATQHVTFFENPTYFPASPRASRVVHAESRAGRVAALFVEP